MSRRSRAREVVLQLLYRDDLNGRGDEVSDREFLRVRLQRKVKLIEFADSILQGVRQHQDAIDAKLEATTENWKVSRMAATDRNVLRIAAWEILFGETPPRVAINEAIEISKRYGDVRSPKFVNGVLDQLMKNAASGTLAEPSSPATAPAIDEPENESSQNETPEQVKQPSDSSTTE